MPTDVLALLLAAGNSKRLGIPKQLIRLQGKTLVNRAIDQLLHAGCSKVAVILGFKADQISAAIESEGTRAVQCVYNPAWADGQSSSLRCGVDFIERANDTHTQVLVALCDQPMIPISHYTRLIDGLQGGKKLSATAYPEGGGVPACFQRACIEQLKVELGDEGAKQWIRQQPSEDVELIACADAIYDLDTPSSLDEISFKLAMEN